MSCVSDRVLDAVEAKLPTELESWRGVAPRDITGVPYSLISVRHALRELVQAGRAHFEGPDCHRRYWRVAP